MKFRYRNVKTGEVITTTNRVGGKKWEAIEDEPVLPPEDESGEENVKEPEEAPVEKSAAKASRKGKK